MIPTVLTLSLISFGLWLFRWRAPTVSARIQRGHPERRRVRCPLILEAPNHQAFSVSSYDISSGGCYICFKDMQSSMNKTALLGSRTGIKIGDALRIRLHDGRFSSLSLEGRVVRMELEPLGSYPAGVGIQFTNVTRSRQKRLRMIVADDQRLEAA